ncbi:hypothetical protein O181_051875 [Austropuccinia psidii MF-1]|uniref:Exocyst complex protein EXO70 n=1 Tax=Austropuccinia psidii MF-1 TaxID=1389203 RepID=A0A9Q3DXW7_9BASI|nr:hypothetical protein [Austropuccinia psidii MF-1]
MAQRLSNQSASFIHNNNQNNLDQSIADLVLLSTSLKKSDAITDKLSKLLTGFDERLSKLEKSIVPIHHDTRTLTQINSNINQTILTLDQLLGNHDAALRQKAIIQNGPDSMNLAPFLSALDEILKSFNELSLAGSSSHDSAPEIEKMLIDGAQGLNQIFSKSAQDLTGPPLTDPIRQTADLSHLNSQSNSRITQLHNLFAYFQKLASSTKKNKSFLEIEKQIITEYVSIRTKYLIESLKPVASSSIEAMRNGDGGGVFASFIACCLDMFNSEHQFIVSIFKGFKLAQIKGLYSQVISASLQTLLETGQSVNNVIKRSLSSYIGAAFDIYETISDQLSRFDQVVRRLSGRKENELGDLLHGFKGSCLRSLPEFIADAKTFGDKQPIGSEICNTMTSEMTIGVIDYLKMLCNHVEIVESFLTVLGDGNWIFGANSTTTRPSHYSDNPDHPHLLVKYLNDALSTLYTALEARSKNLKLRSTAANTITSPTARNGIGAIFLLNNFTYIRREILESTMIDILGDQLEDDLNKKVRMYKVRYLEIWSPLISALMDAGPEEGKFGLGAVKSALPGQHSGAEKRDVKDRLGRFNDAFEEVINLHKAAKLDTDDIEIKKRLRDEIDRMILPTYAKFTQRHEAGQFSKNPSKYLKMSAEQLEERLDQLFQ